MTILVGFNSPNRSLSYSVKGIKLTLIPKSSKSLWISWSPMTIKIVWQTGSLYFTGI